MNYEENDRNAITVKDSYFDLEAIDVIAAEQEEKEEK